MGGRRRDRCRCRCHLGRGRPTMARRLVGVPGVRFAYRARRHRRGVWPRDQYRRHAGRTRARHGAARRRPAGDAGRRRGRGRGDRRRVRWRSTRRCDRVDHRGAGRDHRRDTPASMPHAATPPIAGRLGGRADDADADGARARGGPPGRSAARQRRVAPGDTGAGTDRDSADRGRHHPRPADGPGRRCHADAGHPDDGHRNASQPEDGHWPVVRTHGCDRNHRGRRGLVVHRMRAAPADAAVARRGRRGHRPDRPLHT